VSQPSPAGRQTVGLPLRVSCAILMGVAEWIIPRGGPTLPVVVGVWPLQLVPPGSLAAHSVDQAVAGCLLAFRDPEGSPLALGCVKRVDRRGGIVSIRTPRSGL